MAKKQTIKKTGIGATFAANLKLICDVRHVTDEQVADYMGMCRSTFYKKMRLTDEWKMGEVASASRLFKIPQADLVSRMLTPEEASA